MASEDELNRNRVLEYFTGDHQLQSEGLKMLPVEDFYNLLGFDVGGELLYVLFQKEDTPTREKYMVEINLHTDETSAISLNAILGLEIHEFFELTKKSI